MADQHQAASLPQGSQPQAELNPLDFVKSRLGQQTIALKDAVPGFIPAGSTPAPAQQNATPVPAVPPIASKSEADAFVDALVNAVPAEAPVTPIPGTSIASEPLSDETPEPGKTPEQSFKDMRKILKKVNTELEENKTLLTQTKDELEKYRTGEAVPEVIQQKEERIAQLEHYEKIHGLKMSPEYQQKFVEPYNQVMTQAQKLAKDYGVGDDVLQEALTIENKRELNSFLRSHFDDVGALEVRTLLDTARILNGQARDAEIEPQKAMTQLREEFRVQQQASEEKRVTTIKHNAQSGWTSALQELSSSGEYPELTLTGDVEHDKIARQVRTEAATEFGKFIKLLGDYGVKDLPPEAAKIVAKRFQLSQASSVMAASRAHHYSRSEELLNQTRRQASMIRPPIGGVADSAPPPAPVRSNSLEQNAENLLNSVLQKKR